jgi:hypothetical protein
MVRRILQALVALALVVTGAGMTAGPTSASPAAPATPASPDAPAVDPAFPSDWLRWRLQVQNPNDRSRLSLDAQHSGGHGAPAWLWGDNNGDAQLWIEETAAEGGIFIHPGYDRWLCLGHDGGFWGSAVDVQNCNGSANQRFVFYFGTGFREIRSMDGNLCVDVPNSNFVSGQTLWLWGCNGGVAQRWITRAPSRSNSQSEPVYFVPGHTSAVGHDCQNGYWGEAMAAMGSWGWSSSRFHTVGFYLYDQNCNTQLGRWDRGVGLDEIGRILAWDIYNRYSSRGISVDIMAHSMGGLIAQAAVFGVQQGQWEGNGWPPYLYVEDVVTLSTPHGGTPYGTNVVFCGTVTQCVQMREGSDFLNWVGQNPQSQQGTDWTLIGAEDDDIVTVDSAIAMSAGHKVKYPACPPWESCIRFEHSMIHKITSGSVQQVYWNYYDPDWWYSTGSGAVSVRSARNALYYWNSW